MWRLNWSALFAHVPKTGIQTKKGLDSSRTYAEHRSQIYVLGGWSGGAMVLGKLPVPGRPTIWITVGQGPTALAVGAGGGCLDIFTLIYPFFPLSPSLWETARYRLKYCLKGPLNPKPTNQPNPGRQMSGNKMLVSTISASLRSKAVAIQYYNIMYTAP